MNFEKTKLASWMEWKKECALALCKPAAQADLQDWAVPIFLRAERTNGVTADELEERAKRRSNGVSDAWYDLEQYYKKFSKKYEKRWKDHVSDLAADEPTDNSRRDTYEKQTNLRIRALATDERRAAKRDQQLFPYRVDEPVSSDPDAPTWGAVHAVAPEPTPDAVAAWNELCELAEREVDATLPRLSSRERFALGCKGKRVALYLPEVLSAAACGKTQLNEAAKQAEEKFHSLAGEMQAKYAGESAPEDLEEFLRKFKQVFLGRCQESVPPEILRLSRF